MNDTLRIARAALHMWEEPCISGEQGSGAVFFSGCQMHCVFCQNASIANGEKGRIVDAEQLSDILLKLQDMGANNINLVTPDHFVPHIIRALEKVRGKTLTIPVVYNTSAYVNVETIRALDGFVDIYLPDLKYYSKDIAMRYAKTGDYFEIATRAIEEMVRQTGKPVFYEREHPKKMYSAQEYNDKEDNSLLMKRGTIVRHLLLPGALEDSMKIVKYLLERYGEDIYLSLMNQYTPVNFLPQYPELNRKVDNDKYETLIDYAISCGIENGFIQDGDTAKESFIPDFNEKGILD